MTSERVAFVTEKMPLMPPLYENSSFVERLCGYACEGKVEHILTWLYLMMR